MVITYEVSSIVSHKGVDYYIVVLRYDTGHRKTKFCFTVS
jgi:hypothetical protein